MLLRSTIVSCVVAVIAVVLVTRKAGATDACARVTEHASDTVILFSPPASFTICHAGHEETDAVTGRRVYLQLVATPGAGMFRFRVHGQEAEPKLTGLAALYKQTTTIADALEELTHSSQHVASVAVDGGGTPFAVARARYLGVVTPAFSDSLARGRAASKELPEAVRIVRKWCDEFRSSTLPSAREVKDACTTATSADDTVKESAAFDASVTTFDTARDLAREAAIAQEATRSDDVASASARTLDSTRATAEAVVASSSRLAKLARGVSRDVAALRTALASLGALQRDVPTYLSTYSEAGNAVLRIDAVPVGVADGASTDENAVTFRFPIVGRHYFDIEIGAGITSGQPLIPTTTTNNGATVIDGKPVDEFVALALVELEPLRFLWPDKPLAGLLRFPVIGIPLSRDPTQNFFVGGGIGWTGIGSITVGPYLLRELALLPGHAIGDPLPANTSLDAITNPQVNVGFFVSASIDVVGLFRLFVPERLPTIDAATGRE